VTLPVGPVTPRRRVRDIITPFRVVCTIALAAAALLLVFGFQSSVDQHSATCGVGPIVRFFPCPGDTDLRQGIIGVALDNGYTGVLVVDQREIPQDQTHSGGANQIYFQPGPGTETGALAPGVHSATVIYWPTTGTRDHDARSFPWSFSVT